MSTAVPRPYDAAAVVISARTPTVLRDWGTRCGWSGVTAGLVEHWLESGRLELPLPASGRTAERWQRLARLAEDNIVAARIAESHVDAVAILHELGGKPPDAGSCGAWTAEAPDTALTATDTDGAFTLHGTKVWCAGAGFCTHALVTARLEDGTQGLFAVTVTDPAVKALPSTWWNAGMAGSDTRPVHHQRPGRRRATPGPTRVGRGSGTAQSVSPPVGSVGRAASLTRYIAVPQANPPTRTRWHTWAQSMPRWPPATRSWPRRRSRSTPIRSTDPGPRSCWPAASARSWNTLSTRRLRAPDAPWARARCARTDGTLNGSPI